MQRDVWVMFVVETCGRLTHCLFVSFLDTQILLEGGETGASPALRSLIRGMQKSGHVNFRVEFILPTESFPKSTACMYLYSWKQHPDCSSHFPNL